MPVVTTFGCHGRHHHTILLGMPGNTASIFIAPRAVGVLMPMAGMQACRTHMTELLQAYLTSYVRHCRSVGLHQGDLNFKILLHRFFENMWAHPHNEDYMLQGMGAHC